MANQLVGLENVPNVYISRITLNDNNTQSYTATVRLEVLDVELSKGFMWKSDSSFYDSLSISLISTRDERLIKGITDGTISAHPYELSKASSDYQCEMDIIPISEFAKVQTETLCSYYKAIKKDISWETKDYVVFALCFIDTKNLAKKLEIDLGGFLKNFSGAVTSEIIIENHKTIPLTNLFLQDDKKVWPGPIHIRSSQYMAGSKPTNTYYQPLKRISVQNLKVIDQRTILYKQRQDLKETNNSIIGPLNWSINKDIDLLGMFSVNIKQFALLKTKHGKTMSTMSPRLFQEFLGTIEINSMSIIRQQVKTVRIGNRLGTPMVSTNKVSSYEFVENTIDGSPNNLKNTDKIQQIYLSPDYRIRTYQFKDNEKNAKSKGQYRYKAEISILDKSQQFLNNIIDQMQLEVTKLKDLVFRLNKKTNYDYKSNKLKGFLETPTELLGIIKSYCNFMAYIKIMDIAEIAYEINQRTMNMASANYTSLAGEKFIVEYEQLATNFSRKFKIRSKYNVTTRPRNIKKAFIPNLTMISKEFYPIIQFNDYRRYYDYLGTKVDLKSPITLDVMKNRSTLESTRFFTEGASRTTKEFDTLDNKMSKALTDIEEASQNFIAPVSFMYDNFIFDLKDLSNVDNEGLTTQFFKSNTTSENQIRPHKAAQKSEKGPKKTRANSPKGDRKQKRNGKFKKKFAHSFRIPKYSTKTVQRSLDINSNKYLGEGSDFSSPDGNYETQAVTKYQAAATNLLNTSALKTGVNKFKFDLKAPKSKIGQAIRSKSIKATKLKRAPVAWKALVCSRSQAAKNEILSTSGDVLQNPETKVSTQMIFQTSQKIEILTGYKKDKNNNPILSAPIWQEVDYSLIPASGGLICRLSYTEIPELGISPDELFKLPYLDQVFILTNDNVTDNITEIPSDLVGSNINMNTKNQLSKNIKYATTNIIKQSGRKDPLAMKPAAQEAAPRRRSSTAPSSTGMTGGSSTSGPTGMTGGSY